MEDGLLRYTTCAGLSKAFGIRSREVASLVGAGGKTTLMFALARELSSKGHFVITTTTTKIMEPDNCISPALFLSVDEEEAVRWVIDNADHYRHVTLAQERIGSGKLRGIGPQIVDRLAGLRQVPYILVEADGAAHRSLKAPKATEPVIPGSSSLVIPIVGADAIGCRLTDEVVFRPEVVSSLLGLRLGEMIPIESIADLITHEQGLAKGSPIGARIIPFINKVGSTSDLGQVKRLAAAILKSKRRRIARVVFGEAAHPEQGFVVSSAHPGEEAIDSICAPDYHGP